MSREIKFRGWHTSTNRMFSAEEMASDQLTLLTTGSFINVSGASTSLSVVYDCEKFVPLQYTGLKDKNGVDIYEGDIIHNLFSDGSPCRHVIRYCEESASFGADWNGIPHVGRSTVSQEWISEHGKEVIGNIYANPELINP